LAGCIDRGLNQVADDLQTIQGHVATVRAIQETLEPIRGSCSVREQRFEILRDQLRSSDDLVQRQMGAVMASFQVGLFVGGNDADMPRDNLDLERWFRQPKGHERHIHGHKHAGVRIVQEGPTSKPSCPIRSTKLSHAAISGDGLAPERNVPSCLLNSKHG
jgi:hypothetical protein